MRQIEIINLEKIDFIPKNKVKEKLLNFVIDNTDGKKDLCVFEYENNDYNNHMKSFLCFCSENIDKDFDVARWKIQGLGIMYFYFKKKNNTFVLKPVNNKMTIYKILI